jgi:hypothetical protein
MTPFTRRGGQAATRTVGALAAGLALIAAACTVNTPDTREPLVPLIPPDQLPITSLAATSTTAPSSDPNSPLIAALPDGDCVYADAPAASEATFIVGDRLIGASFDGSSVRCLARLTLGQIGPTVWSPVANRAVLNVTTVFDVSGVRASGFDPTATRIAWQYPVGDGLIAPTPSEKTLVRRSATDGSQRSELTFLARTRLALSHPSGLALLAAGRAGDGSIGVFLADQAGQGARPLLFTTDDRSIDELSVDQSGRTAYVVSTRNDAFALHRLSLADLSVAEVSSSQTPILQAVPGPSATAVAWKSGLCNSITSTWVFDDRTGSAVTVGSGTPLDGLSVAPLGWLDAGRLAVAARTIGCDGPADIWIWNLLDGSATLLVKSVVQPSLRVVRPQATMPLIDPAVQPQLL